MENVKEGGGEVGADDSTANHAGQQTTQLERKASALTEAAAVVDLFLKLLEAKVGTNAVEVHAESESMAKERNVKEGRGFLNDSRSS